MNDIKQRQRQMWASGDYRTVAARLQIVSEALCEAVDLRGGQVVLDVATGTGNTAIAAARRWCDVTAIDSTTFGPLLKALEALDESNRERLIHDLHRVIAAFNEATDGTLVVPSEYLEVVATKS